MNDPIQEELIRRTKIELLTEILDDIIMPVTGETDRFPLLKDGFTQCKAMFRDDVIERLSALLPEEQALNIYYKIKEKYPTSNL